MTLLSRATLSVTSITLVVISFTSTLIPTQAQKVDHPLSQTSSVQPTSNKETIKYREKKLKLEVEKLEIENLNSNRNLLSLRGWINLLFGNVSIIIATVVGFWGLYRYLEERYEERQNKENECFAATVKSLGSEHEQERLNAALLLPTFLDKQHKRFHIQIFNLAAGNLRKKQSDDSLTQVLVTVLRNSYPLARNTLLKKHRLRWLNQFKHSRNFLEQFSYKIMAFLEDEKRRFEIYKTRQYLNAANIILSKAYLENTDLNCAWLREATLEQTILKYSDLSNAYLELANLSGANLEGAYLKNAYLYKTNLEGAYLENANLEGAYLESTKFSNANLNNTILRRAKLESADLLNASLYYANLNNTNLRRANLEGAYLLNAYLYKTNLEGANLKDAYLEGANLSGAYLQGANLEGANLEYAYLSGAYLSGAYLENISWNEQTDWREVKRWETARNIPEELKRLLVKVDFSVEWFWILDKRFWIKVLCLLPSAFCLLPSLDLDFWLMQEV